MNRINKATARKLWNEGKAFIIVACNLRPEYGLIATEGFKVAHNYNFNDFVNTFSYYNCGSAGKYPAFYTEE